MKYTLNSIIERYNKNEKLDYIFFWGHTSNNGITKACFSQWYKSYFIVDDIKYSTAEQFMMAQKALLFNDLDTYNKIIKTDNPSECKSLGRKVKNFNEEIWNENKYNIVLKGNLAKFSQNEKLKNFILSTNNKILAEASPYDTIWGIGLLESVKGIENPNNWLGKNLLGYSLMEVRDIL